MCLFPVPPLLEYEQTFNPFRDLLAKEPIVHKNGFVDVSNKPGLGVEVDRAILDKYRVK
jgi:D-galactarolactone cycloisomerase